MRANNVWNGIGRLGKDPEIRHSGSNKYATFTLAVTKSKTETNWFNCTAWNNLADLAEKYLRKGSHIAITGPIDIRQQDGKTYVNVTVEGMEFLSTEARDVAEPRAEERQPELVSVSSTKKRNTKEEEPALPPF